MVAGLVQSRRPLAVVGLVIVAVLILNLALWLLYRDMRRDLEADLGRSLENLAVLVASSLDPAHVQAASFALERNSETNDSLAAFLDADLQRVFLDLKSIQNQINVANLTLYAPSTTPVLDIIHFENAQQPRDPLISSELLLSLEAAIPAHTILYRNQWMTGYAPMNVFGETFAIGVEADAPFFVILSRLRRSLLLVGALSVVLLLALGGFFLTFHHRVARAEAAARRADTLAAVGRMSAGIAHDIRNPLKIIRATATRLKKSYDDPAHPDEKLEFIPEEVDRLNSTLTSYLQFAKEEPPQLQMCDVSETVSKTLRMMHAELTEAQIELQTQLPEGSRGNIDEHYLRQAILNVVLNAKEAMPQGGVLKVSLTRQSHELRLRFVDTGEGLAPEVRARALDPFFTTKEQGSGLGLAMVRRIVEQHDGRVTLGEAPEGGALVDIFLPTP